MQHWMYASVYLDAALVTRLYFGARTEDSVKNRESREKVISRVNGFLYFFFLAVITADLFLDSN